MDPSLRPDLGKILAPPLTSRLAGAESRWQHTLAVRPGARDEDFVVDVQRRSDAAPGDAGFGLAQATAVSRRLAQLFAQHAPEVRSTWHRVDEARAHALFAPDPDPERTPRTR